MAAIIPPFCFLMLATLRFPHSISRISIILSVDSFHSFFTLSLVWCIHRKWYHASSVLFFLSFTRWIVLGSWLCIYLACCCFHGSVNGSLGFNWSTAVCPRDFGMDLMLYNRFLSHCLINNVFLCWFLSGDHFWRPSLTTKTALDIFQNSSATEKRRTKASAFLTVHRRSPTSAAPWVQLSTISVLLVKRRRITRK